jgi:phage repressor protein C with HTH and peptisase S24 domain
MKMETHRLQIILDDLKMNANSFANALGMKRAQGIYDVLNPDKNLGISNKLADKIIGQFPQYRKEWLVFGTGEKYDDSRPYLEKRRTIKLENTKKEKAVPLIDAVATGSDTENDMSPISHASDTIVVGDLLQDSQAAMRIYGNSMLPNYPSGCVVGLIQCDKTFIEPGEVYVLETDDRRVLKRLFYKDDDYSSGFFYCVSDNTMKFEGGSRNGKLAYPGFTIPIDKVIRLFLVTGVIKRNTNSQVIRR